MWVMVLMECLRGVSAVNIKDKNVDVVEASFCSSFKSVLCLVELSRVLDVRSRGDDPTPRS